MCIRLNLHIPTGATRRDPPPGIASDPSRASNIIPTIHPRTPLKFVFGAGSIIDVTDFVSIERGD
jgi:hypothetical protein